MVEKSEENMRKEVILFSLEVVVVLELIGGKPQEQHRVL